MEEIFHKWFSPPDPYTNYNVACETQSEGTAAWFFEETKFKDWMSVGSLLWIHGKRKLRLNFIAHKLMVSELHSWVWEKHPLVCDFSIIIENDRDSVSLQFCRYQTRHFVARCRTGLPSVFLL